MTTMVTNYHLGTPSPPGTTTQCFMRLHCCHRDQPTGAPTLLSWPQQACLRRILQPESWDRSGTN
jgi:hypothetical protein